MVMPRRAGRPWQLGEAGACSAAHPWHEACAKMRSFTGYTKGRTMRIVSWNIQWGRGADGWVDLARTRATLATLGTPEVICLQEVAVNFAGLPGGPPQDDLAWLEAAFPDYEPVYAPGLDVPAAAGVGRSRFGNLLLSRLPGAPSLARARPSSPVSAR